MKRILILAAATLSGPGCDIQFTTPAAAGPRPATLLASFDFVDAATRRLELEAFLDPGTGADGQLRAVPNDTLHFGSYAGVSPLTNVDGTRHYSRSWLDSSDSNLSGLGVHAPQIPAIGGVPAAISFGVHYRAGPMDIVITPTDTIELVVASGLAPSRPPEQASWLLEIGSRNVLNLHRSGSGEAPSTLRVPAEWLQWADGEPLRAQLRMQRIWTVTSADGDYRMMLQVWSTLQWQITWAAPSAGDD